MLILSAQTSTSTPYKTTPIYACNTSLTSIMEKAKLFKSKCREIRNIVSTLPGYIESEDG